MPSVPTPLRLAPALLAVSLAACGDVRIKFPDSGAPGDTGSPDSGDTGGDTDTSVPVDPFPGSTPLAEADILLEGVPRDGIGYGGSLAVPGDILGSEAADLLVGARYAEGGGGQYAGAVYLVSDPPLGTSSLADATAAIRGTVPYAQFGTSVAMAGDVDGDGFPDLAVGASGAGEGRVYLFRGPFADEDRQDTDAEAVLIGETEYGMAGHTLWAAGDVNGDGLADVAVGEPNSAAGCQGCGAVMVSLAAGAEGERLLNEDAVRIYGDRTYGMAGYGYSSAMDLDGDGSPEITVGMPYSAGGGVGVFYGPFRSGSFGLMDADAWFASETVGGAAGTSITGVDLDGDGYDELVVGAPQDVTGGTYSGKVFVELGSATRWSGEHVLGAGAVYTGAASDYAGGALAPAGDVDGDGTNDLLVGATYAGADYSYGGAAYLVRGPVSAGVYDLAAAPPTFAGSVRYGYAGAALAGPGDIDGGGVPDVAIGAMAGVEPGTGVIYIVLGE